MAADTRSLRERQREREERERERELTSKKRTKQMGKREREGERDRERERGCTVLFEEFLCVVCVDCVCVDPLMIGPPPLLHADVTVTITLELFRFDERENESEEHHRTKHPLFPHSTNQNGNKKKFQEILFLNRGSYDWMKR
jgi:hypothetical protein